MYMTNETVCDVNLLGYEQDVGGEDRPFDAELLPLLDFLSPNENELQRLTGMPTDTQEQV